jgi:hypothetical protein
MKKEQIVEILDKHLKTLIKGKYEDHRLNEGVMAWGYPINYR